MASAVKKSLRGELNLKSITKTKDEPELEKYEPTSVLAKQVISAINEHFDSRETTYQPIGIQDDFADLELTDPDHTDKNVYIAPRYNENDGMFENMRQVPPMLESTSTFTRQRDFMQGGASFSTNYNGFGQKNSIIPQDITEEQWKEGYYYKWAKHPVRFWGNISTEALTESLGYPGMRKIVGITI